MLNISAQHCSGCSALNSFLDEQALHGMPAKHEYGRAWGRLAAAAAPISRRMQRTGQGRLTGLLSGGLTAAQGAALRLVFGDVQLCWQGLAFRHAVASLKGGPCFSWPGMAMSGTQRGAAALSVLRAACRTACWPACRTACHGACRRLQAGLIMIQDIRIMNSYINSWLDNFERQCMIRRAIQINGNIMDLAFSRMARMMPVKKVIEDSLKALGFRYVVSYSRVSGISGMNVQDFLRLSAPSCDFVQGDEYDMGDDEPDAADSQSASDSLDGSGRGGTSGSGRGSGGLLGGQGQNVIDPLTFFSTVKNVLTDENDTEKVAFLVDWSNLLFGQVNNLTEVERSWLSLIADALCDSPVSGSSMQMKEPRSLIIFMCAGSAGLPPDLFINNPLFASISIALPSIREREAAMTARSSHFKLKEPLVRTGRTFAEMVTLTDGLNLRDIDNLVRLSNQQEKSVDVNSLVSLYRYGTRQSPWEQLNHGRLAAAKDELRQRVKGQDQCIDSVYRVLIRAYTGLSGLQHSSKARTPKGALFFVGPTGVGKTELAKALAQFLFGDEDACIRFDMSEFNHEHADQRLIGAPPGYVGYEQGGQLTNAVRARPFSLLLFDEIEKAHPRILDKFLQILEDGRLSDGKGETISFADTFIVFTSNIGAATVEQGDERSVAAQFKSAVEHHFTSVLQRPELLGRIGDANIIPFNFITDKEILRQIARAKLEPLRNRVKEKWGITALEFEDDNDALDFIVSRVDLRSGGRGVLNAMISYLFDPLSEFLFDCSGMAGQLRGRSITMSRIGPQFLFDIS